jgi:hypothetical protein
MPALEGQFFEDIRMFGSRDSIFRHTGAGECARRYVSIFDADRGFG